jgi:tRNA dimethylallyltransferase
MKAEILSADAFQVYKGLEVGTAQPPVAWQKEVKHHLVGIKNPSEGWNAADFAKEAKKVLESAVKEKRKLLIVGGSGFYLKTLVEGMPPGSAPAPETRDWVLREVTRLGPEKAHEWLQERDEKAAQRLHPSDTRRICRALEKTFSVPAAPSDFEPLGVENVLFVGLERSRENLDNLLRARTEAMWEGGLLPETQALLDSGLPLDRPLWGAIGYAEASSFLKGELKAEEAKERIFRRTRQYAKRQWTWFKHQHSVEWVNLDEFPDPQTVVNFLCDRYNLKNL